MTTMTAASPSPAVPNSPARRLPVPAAVAMTAAPALWLTGWALMRIEGHKGPGWGWTTAHAVWVAAFLLFAGAAVALYRLADARSVPAKAGALTGVIMAGAGLAAMLGQMGIDLYVGFTAANRDAMESAYAPFMDNAAVDLFFFQVGPALLFVGLLVQTITVAARGRASVLAPVLVGLGITAMVAGRALPSQLRFVEGLGELCLWLGMVAVVRHRVKG